MVRRVFTPVQANRTLPLVRRIVADILEKGQELKSFPPGKERALERSNELRSELDELTNELRQIGCSYKDWGFHIGLVDFPARIEGRPVLLCWRSDEDRVGWFHSLQGGYTARRPIPAELLADCEEEKTAFRQQ